MESILLNIVTVGLSSCLLPFLSRLILKRPLGKVAAVIVIAVNSILMIAVWVFLRGLILTGGMDSQPAGGNYISYGVGIAAFASWGILTKSEEKIGSDADNFKIS